MKLVVGSELRHASVPIAKNGVYATMYRCAVKHQTLACRHCRISSRPACSVMPVSTSSSDDVGATLAEPLAVLDRLRQLPTRRICNSSHIARRYASPRRSYTGKKSDTERCVDDGSSLAPGPDDGRSSRTKRLYTDCFVLWTFRTAARSLHRVKLFPLSSPRRTS